MVVLTNDSNTVSAFPTVILISTHHHLPIKLTSTTFSSSRAHLCTLLNGFSLIGHIDGTIPQPDVATLPEVVARWFQQDQLLLAAILGSVWPDILPLLSSATTAAAVYTTLSRAFVSTSRAHVMFLKTSLTKATLGARTIVEYVNNIKALTDELGLIDTPIKDDDLTLYIINGLPADYREIVSSVRTRETPFRFEELCDRLVKHEAYLKQLDAATSALVATANVAQFGSSPPRFSSSRGGRGSSFQSRGHRVAVVVNAALLMAPMNSQETLLSLVNCVVTRTTRLHTAVEYNPLQTWLTLRRPL